MFIFNKIKMSRVSLLRMKDFTRLMSLKIKFNVCSGLPRCRQISRRLCRSHDGRLHSRNLYMSLNRKFSLGCFSLPTVDGYVQAALQPTFTSVPHFNAASDCSWLNNS